MIGSRRLGFRNFEKDADRLDTEMGSASLPPSALALLLNKIILIPSGTGTPTVYPKTAAGMTSALAASSSGDTIYTPSGTISGNHTVPAGVTVWGYYYNTILSGTITNNGVVFNVRITGSISNGTSTAFYRVFDGSSVEHFVYGTAVDLRWQFGNAGVTPSFTAMSLDASGKAAALIAGIYGGGIAVQNDGFFSVIEEPRSAFTSDTLGNVPGTGFVLLNLYASTGNLLLKRQSVANPSDPGYKLYIDGTLYIGNYTDIPEIAAPSAPSADVARFYAKDDGGTTKLYYKRSDGTEVEIGGGGVGAHNILSASHTDSNSGDTPVEGDALVYRSSQWEAEAPVDISGDSSGITAVNVDEQVSDPAAPGAGNRIIYAKSGGIYERDSAGTVTGPLGTSTDSDAIHDNVDGEINAVTEKVSPVGADVLLLEDSAASYAKKKVQITNLPGGADADAIHDNVSGEIAAVTEKASPVSGDLILIEDSAASNAKKRVQIGNLPSGSGDSTYTAAYASRPAASNDGDLFLPSDGFQIERDTGAAWAPWGPLFPFTAPVSGDFAWINQGGASISTTNGGIYLLGPAGAGANWRIRKKAAPSVPYTITAAILPHIHGADLQHCGLCFRQSSDGKLVVFTIHYESVAIGWKLAVYKYTNPTTFSAAYTTVGCIPGLLFLRIADNNTSRICSWSTNGQNFHAIHTVGRTDFLTADEVGFLVNAQNATYPAGMTLLSWKEA